MFAHCFTRCKNSATIPHEKAFYVYEKLAQYPHHASTLLSHIQIAHLPNLCAWEKLLAIKGGYGSGHLGTKRISFAHGQKHNFLPEIALIFRVFLFSSCENICRKPGNRRCLLDDSSFVSFFLPLSRHIATAEQRRLAYYLYTCMCAREEGFSIIYSACAPRESESHSLRAASSISRAPPVWTDSQITGSKADVSTVKRAAHILGTNIAI